MAEVQLTQPNGEHNDQIDIPCCSSVDQYGVCVYGRLRRRHRREQQGSASAPAGSKVVAFIGFLYLYQGRMICSGRTSRRMSSTV